jgi:hypothetical protein
MASSTKNLAHSIAQCGTRIAEFKAFEKNPLSVRNVARAEGGVDIKIREDFEPVRWGGLIIKVTASWIFGLPRFLSQIF